MTSVILSEKNKTLFNIDGYKFRYHKTLKNDVQRWSCCKKTCKSYIKLNNENEIIERANDHNHIKDSVEVFNRQQLSNNLKRKAVEELYDKPSKLIHGALSKDIPTLTTYDLTLIRNNIHHARSSTIPKLPDNLPDLHNVLLNENIQTNRDENFLLVNDNENNIIIFSTITNLNFLSEVDTIFVDGTFKSCPKLFTQFFTVHGLKNNNYIPLVFFLLPNKNIDTYIKAFSHLKSEFLKNNINFSPKITFIDFENNSLIIINHAAVSSNKRMQVSFRSKLVEEN